MSIFNDKIFKPENNIINQFGVKLRKKGTIEKFTDSGEKGKAGIKMV